MLASSIVGVLVSLEVLMEADDLIVERLDTTADGQGTRYRITRPNGQYVWEVDMKRTTRVRNAKLEPGVLVTIMNPPQYRARSGFMYTEEAALMAIKHGVWEEETHDHE